MPELTCNDGLWYLLLIDKPVHRTISVHPNLTLDLDEDGRLIGIEGLGPVQFVKHLVGFWHLLDKKPIYLPYDLEELK